MSSTKYPVIVVANPLNVNEYVACIDASIAEVISIPHLYGYPQVTESVGISLEPNDQSFRMKKVNTPHFFNTVRVPLKHRTVELIIFDRDGLKAVAKRLEATDGE
jgi:hypothetical protein